MTIDLAYCLIHFTGLNSLIVYNMFSNNVKRIVYTYTLFYVIVLFLNIHHGSII